MKRILSLYLVAVTLFLMIGTLTFAQQGVKLPLVLSFEYENQSYTAQFYLEAKPPTKQPDIFLEDKTVNIIDKNEGLIIFGIEGLVSSSGEGKLPGGFGFQVFTSSNAPVKLARNQVGDFIGKQSIWQNKSASQISESIIFNMTIELMPPKGVSVAARRKEFTIRLRPDIKANPLEECQKLATAIEQYDCLKSKEPTEAVKNAFAALEEDRTNTRNLIKGGFQLVERSDNKYTLSCQSCDIKDFELRETTNRKPKIKERKNRSWEIELRGKGDVELEIYSKKWDMGEVFPISLEYKESQIENDPEEVEAEVVEEKIDTFLTEEMDSTNIENPDEESSTLIAEPKMVSFTESFWQEEVRTFITPQSIFFLDSSAAKLNQNLTAYLAFTEPKKNTLLATILRQRVWIFAVLGALFLWLGFRGFLKGNEKPNPAIKAKKMTLPPKEKGKTTKGLAIARTVKPNLSEEPKPIPSEEQEESFDIVFSEIKMTQTTEKVEKRPLQELITDNNYLKLDLTQCWTDTAVSQVYFRHKSLEDIDAMLKREYPHLPIPSEDINASPEIGGFLLGHVYPEENQTHQVTIEEFIPITAESKNRYTVKFGDQAWIELDDALKANRGMNLVGWFHTHPGHNLFLSEADLREHRSLFRKRFQLAVEIEPSTENLDIAFFTWTRNNDLNNHSDSLLPHWWSFTKLLNRH